MILTFLKNTLIISMSWSQPHRKTICPPSEPSSIAQSDTIDPGVTPPLVISAAKKIITLSFQTVVNQASGMKSGMKVAAISLFCIARQISSSLDALKSLRSEAVYTRFASGGNTSSSQACALPDLAAIPTVLWCLGCLQEQGPTKIL